jgi:hypothetical protein
VSAEEIHPVHRLGIALRLGDEGDRGQVNDCVGTRRLHGFRDTSGIPDVQLQIGADHLGARSLETSLESPSHEAGDPGHEHPHARRLPERTAHCYLPAPGIIAAVLSHRMLGGL